MKPHLLFVALCSLCFWYCEQNPFVQGQRLYEYHCSGCHMSDGTGMAKLYPPLAEEDYLASRLQELPCMIKYGITDSIIVNQITYTEPMKGIPSLTEAEIANICNYISYRWHDHEMSYTETSVRKLLTGCTK